MKYIGLSFNKMFNKLGHNFMTTFHFRFEKNNCGIDFPYSIETENKNYDKIYHMMFFIDEIFKKVEPSIIDLMINLIKRMLKEVGDDD